MYSLPLVDSTRTKTDMELSMNLLDVRADVIGDQIVLVLVDLQIHNPVSNVIYLLDWKRGLMMLVSRASCMQYGTAWAHKHPFSSQLNFPPTFWHTVRQTGRMKACSPYSQKVWYSSSSLTPNLELCRDHKSEG
jgi:hypothetical protein